MKARFALIFCIFAISAKGIPAQATTLYSSSSTARTFSRCVVDKLCQSQAFNSGERGSLVGVADVMAQGLKSIDSGNSGPVSLKILLKAFITSVADIVIHGGDASSTSLRQNAYSTAVEQCSLSTIDRVDIETVSDSLRILYSLENSQIAGVREETAPVGSLGTDVVPPRINPLPLVAPGFPPVMPSPVQNPFMPTYLDRYTETAFKPQARPFNFQQSQLPAQSSFNGPPPLRRPSFGASSSFSQVGSGVLSGQSGDYSSIVDSHIAPSFGFGAFNLPQTKNAAVYPPRASQIGMIAPFQQPPLPQDQYLVQPSGNIGLPLRFDASPLRDTSGATFMGVQGNPDQLSQERQSEYIPYQVGGLRIPQVKESSVRVVAPLINPRPSDDAPTQDKPLPANSHMPSTSENPLPQNVNSFVSTSPASMPEMDKENKNFPADSSLENIVFKILTDSANFREAFDFGINPQNALNLAKIITEQSLTGYDTDMIRESLKAVSDAVVRVNVGSPESYAVALSDALVGVLKTHNLPLFVDGSNVATKMLSNLDALMQIPPEYSSEQSEEFISPADYTEGQETQLPFNLKFPTTTPGYDNVDAFSKALTEAILKSDELASFFCQKNFPPNRTKIYFSLIKFSLADFGPQVSSIAASITAGNLLHLPDEVLCSSYAQTISDTIADILGENGLLAQATVQSIANKMSFSLQQELATPSQVPENGQSSTDLPPKATPIIQTSFTNNFESAYQETSALPHIYNNPSTYPVTSPEVSNHKSDDAPSAIENPAEKATFSSTISNPIQKTSPEAVTQSYTSDIDDAQVASATAIMYSLIPTPAPGMSIPAFSGDKIDKEKLSSFLSKEMESVVSAISDENTQQGKNVNSAPGTVTEGIPESDVSQITEKPQVEENPDTDSPSTPDVHVVKVRSSRHHSESGQSIEYSNKTDKAYSEISSTQYPSNLNKSSFQKLQFSNKTLAESERLSHMTDLLDTKYRDIYGKTISQIATNSITFLKSRDFSLLQLCSKLNVLAPILDIPPLDYCEEYAAIDYLLHVVQSMAKLLKNV